MLFQGNKQTRAWFLLKNHKKQLSQLFSVQCLHTYSTTHVLRYLESNVYQELLITIFCIYYWYSVTINPDMISASKRFLERFWKPLLSYGFFYTWISQESALPNVNNKYK
jgi:hypothetical protein